jgi:hypothetical protein
MKFALLITLATALFVAAVYFFWRSGDLLVQKDYLAGLLHVVSGLALSKAGLELARLAVLARPAR